MVKSKNCQCLKNAVAPLRLRFRRRWRSDEPRSWRAQTLNPPGQRYPSANLTSQLNKLRASLTSARPRLAQRLHTAALKSPTVRGAVASTQPLKALPAMLDAHAHHRQRTSRCGLRSLIVAFDPGKAKGLRPISVLSPCFDLAPRAGFEPATQRLTAACSTS